MLFNEFFFQATLFDYLFQHDYHNDFTGMETINAVNFEDLFDFSPEPADRLSHDERDFQPSPLAIPPTQAPPNSYSSSYLGICPVQLLY